MSYCANLGVVALMSDSPFSSRLVTLEFDAGDTLSIHRAIIPDDSELNIRCDDSDILRLEHVSKDIGNVLVHYLYTHQYQEPPEADSPLTRLRAAFQVYTAARSYKLRGLEDLLRDEIALLSEDFNVFDIIDVVREACPSPVGDDIWFSQYIKSSMKAALSTLPAQAMVHIPADLSDGVVIAKLLLQAVLEVHSEIFEFVDGITSPVDRAGCGTAVDAPSRDAGGESKGVNKVPKHEKKVSFDDVVQCLPLAEPETSPQSGREPSSIIDQAAERMEEGEVGKVTEDVTLGSDRTEGRTASAEVCNSATELTEKKSARSAGLSIETKERPNKPAELPPSDESEGRSPESFHEPELTPMTPEAIRDFFDDLMGRRIVAEPDSVQEQGLGPGAEMECVSHVEQPIRGCWVGLGLGDNDINWDNSGQIPGAGEIEAAEKRKQRESAERSSSLKSDEVVFVEGAGSGNEDPPRDPWAFWGAKKSPRPSI